jgi:hypothetical protein
VSSSETSDAEAKLVLLSGVAVPVLRRARDIGAKKKKKKGAAYEKRKRKCEEKNFSSERKKQCETKGIANHRKK